ncbi:MAG: AhpC/TSA family protein [Chitinophagaceae bacterium]|nr:AhpC/TSA family protein [Chitinophagaceae bacterium]
MKNLLTCFLILSASVITHAQDSSFLLQGKIAGFDRGIIYLNYRNIENVNVLDSVVVTNGLFSIRGKVSEPTRAYLYSSSKKQTDRENANEIMIFIEPSDMKLRLEKGKFFQLQVSGSKTQDEWMSYQKSETAFENKWQPILAKIKKAESEKNWQLYDSLTEKFMIPYVDGKKQLYINFVRTNPGSYISLDLLSFNRHKLEFDSLYLFYHNLASIVKQTKNGIELGQFILKEDSLQIGKPAPIISFTDKDSVSHKLSDFKGKFVLLDFWASWCVPCRQENPYLVEVYKKYQVKGFEIISFSLDREKEKQAWLEAIVQDSMIWIQVCDFKYWNSDITKAFNLFGRGIPVNFLLDADGKIIGRDIRAWKLEEYLLRYMR